MDKTSLKKRNIFFQFVACVFELRQCISYSKRGSKRITKDYWSANMSYNYFDNWCSSNIFVQILQIIIFLQITYKL